MVDPLFGPLGEMDEHERTCEHCRTFRRKVTDGEFLSSLDNVACGNCGYSGMGAFDLRYSAAAEPPYNLDEDFNRCPKCGAIPFARDMHYVELGSSEMPDSGLQTHWGASDMWWCSCGWRDSDEYRNGRDVPANLTGLEHYEFFAREHVAQRGGRFLPPFPGNMARTFPRP